MLFYLIFISARKARSTAWPPAVKMKCLFILSKKQNKNEMLIYELIKTCISKYRAFRVWMWIFSEPILIYFFLRLFNLNIGGTCYMHRCLSVKIQLHRYRITFPKNISLKGIGCIERFLYVANFHPSIWTAYQ